jgi:hypothetical protein
MPIASIHNITEAAQHSHIADVGPFLFAYKVLGADDTGVGERKAGRHLVGWTGR